MIYWSPHELLSHINKLAMGISTHNTEKENARIINECELQPDELVYDGDISLLYADEVLSSLRQAAGLSVGGDNHD